MQARTAATRGISMLKNGFLERPSLVTLLLGFPVFKWGLLHKVVLTQDKQSNS